uniref:Uncharacterized protein n=1 Tax=Anguilla anguilla TaxID=7936 RepID=A0A0E9U5W6_ANGAN
MSPKRNNHDRCGQNILPRMQTDRQ